METPIFLKNEQVLSARASKAEKGALENTYLKIFDHEVGSFKDFLMGLNKYVNEFYNKQDQAAELQPVIDELKQENEALKQQIQQAQSENNNEELQQENEDLQNQITDLQNQLEESRQKTPDANQFMRIHPAYIHVLEDIKTKESKRVGKEVSTYDIIWRTFHEILKNGPADRFFGVSYSNAQLKRLIEKAKKENADE